MKLAPILLLAVGFCLPVLGSTGPSLAPSDFGPPPAVDQPAILPAPSPLPLLAADERLAKPVNLRCSRRPITEVLMEMNRQTGVVISAASDIAEEPAVVYMRDRAVREVMQHLAEHFNYQWRRTTANGESAYELYQDAASRREEQALRDGDTRAMWERLSKLARHLQQLSTRPAPEVEQAFEADRAGSVEFSRRYRDASREEKERLWNGEGARWRDFDANWPAYHAASQPLGRALLQLLPIVPSGEWERIRQGGVVYFDPAAGPGTLRMPAGTARELAGARPTIPETGRADIINNDLQQVQDEWLKTQDRRVLITLGPPNPDLLTLQVEPVALRDRSRSLGFFALGRLEIRIERRGRSLPESDQRLDTVPDAWKTDRILGRKRRPLFAAPLDRWRETDSGLWGRPVVRAAGLAAQTAEEYDLDLVADGYRYQELWKSPESLAENLPNGRIELPLYEALKRWIQPKSEWSLRGEILHVRRRQWYDVRLNEIPVSVAKSWSRRLHRDPRPRWPTRWLYPSCEGSSWRNSRA